MSETAVEDFVDAVLADPKMTKDQKIRWLHAAAKDRIAKLEATEKKLVEANWTITGMRVQIREWAEYGVSSPDMLAFLKENEG